MWVPKIHPAVRAYMRHLYETSKRVQARSGSAKLSVQEEILCALSDTMQELMRMEKHDDLLLRPQFQIDDARDWCYIRLAAPAHRKMALFFLPIPKVKVLVFTLLVDEVLLRKSPWQANVFDFFAAAVSEGRFGATELHTLLQSRNATATFIPAATSTATSTAHAKILKFPAPLF